MILAVFLYVLSTCLWFTIIGATDATGAHRKPQSANGQPIFCNPNNLDLRNASSGEFVLLNDGSFRYQLPHCRLRRFRATEAAKCLRGTHLVFMGDSLSRYFYLDLAAFLAHGKWPMHFVSQWSEGRSFLSEKEYNSWSWFYQDSNRQLNRGSHAMEVCDCFRNDSVGFFEFIQDMFENRHFRYMPNGNLEDTVNDVRLSYIQWWGTMPMRGHRDISVKLPRNKTAVTFLKNWSQALCPRPPKVSGLYPAIALTNAPISTRSIFPRLQRKRSAPISPHRRCSPRHRSTAVNSLKRIFWVRWAQPI